MIDIQTTSVRFLGTLALLLFPACVPLGAGSGAERAFVPSGELASSPLPSVAAPVSTGDVVVAESVRVPVADGPVWPVGARSTKLPSGLFNPMPEGVIAGYKADTGLDVMGIKKPVFAIASGFVDYAEAGHTLWTGPRDTPYCVRIELDTPIPYGDRKITHLYYAHLSELAHVQPEGAKPRTRIEGGDRIGTSGVANGSWHLHLGFLLDGEVEQSWGTFLLEDEIRKVMGGYRKGARLPEG